MCKKHTAVSHNRAESEIISFDAGLRMDGLPGLHFGECVLERLSCKKPKEILSVADEMESFRLIHILTLVCLSQLTMFRPTISTSLHSTQLCFFGDKCDSDPSDQQKDEAQT